MKSNLSPGPGCHHQGFLVLCRARGAQDLVALLRMLSPSPGKPHPTPVPVPLKGQTLVCPALSSVPQAPNICWDTAKGKYCQDLHPQQRAQSGVWLRSAAVKSPSAAPRPPCPPKPGGKSTLLSPGLPQSFFLSIQTTSAPRLYIYFLTPLLWLVAVQGRKVCAISCCLSLVLLRYCKNVRYPPVGCNHFTLMFHSC